MSKNVLNLKLGFCSLHIQVTRRIKHLYLISNADIIKICSSDKS
jgi:hypothetical protein